MRMNPTYIFMDAEFQYRKRYGLHAIIRWMSHSQSRIRFQYRKRYGLHAICWLCWYQFPHRRFNTASGMDCMQCGVLRAQGRRSWVSIPQAVWIACNKVGESLAKIAEIVSIPQAVWIACNMRPLFPLRRVSVRFNTASGMDCMQ